MYAKIGKRNSVSFLYSLRNPKITERPNIYGGEAQLKKDARNPNNEPVYNTPELIK